MRRESGNGTRRFAVLTTGVLARSERALTGETGAWLARGRGQKRELRV
jgi:hypothetical protein